MKPRRTDARDLEPEPAEGHGFDLPARTTRLERLVEAQGAELERVRQGFSALLRVVEQHAGRLDARTAPLPPPEPVAPGCRACGASLAGRRPQTRFCGDACRKRKRRRQRHGLSGF